MILNKDTLSDEVEKRDENFIQGDTGNDIQKIYKNIKDMNEILEDIINRLELLEGK